MPLDTWRDDSRKEMQDLLTRMRLESRLPRRVRSERPEIAELLAEQTRAVTEELAALRRAFEAFRREAAQPAPVVTTPPPASAPASASAPAPIIVSAPSPAGLDPGAQEALRSLSSDVAALREAWRQERDAADRRDKDALSDEIKALRQEFAPLKLAPDHSGALSELRAELAALREAWTQERDAADRLAKDELAAEVRSLAQAFKEKPVESPRDTGLEAELASLRSEVAALGDARRGERDDALAAEIRSLSQAVKGKPAETAGSDLKLELSVLRSELGALKDARRAEREDQDRREKDALASAIGELREEVAGLKSQLALGEQARTKLEEDKDRLLTELAKTQNHVRDIEAALHDARATALSAPLKPVAVPTPSDASAREARPQTRVARAPRRRSDGPAGDEFSLMKEFCQDPADSSPQH